MLGDFGFVKLWVGIVVGGCKLKLIIMSVLFWPCGLWDVSGAAVGAISVCFGLVSLCWLVLWVGLWGARLCPALKTSGGGCFSSF